ncbi:2Fe-2S iron-sulfur cluster-binding protein [Rhodalgimonas zhirmunskyi]|uniref:2Fe-2S iron-sulfur cluster-binding protein n=1 Tax=Rhodalgimonas zhirmunskyi TaxID=2964767 RepID=A0AAJ1UA08_9RHOB|nr:2Fe-2S iron-sulfur cluster-binding protein [Rhodoalgimonas zhirmunskyi]MDQ2095540.1 2Fe-2S iron-sulfur cluster-binding protein [Rhodoalgimonas zhirmunskyi]
MSAHRVAGRGRIDADAPLNFSFDGRAFQGRRGDTIASALLANGVRVMGRSFKYHRPRGPWGAWVDDPNAIMNVALNGVELPNCPATTTYLEEGMAARSVNAFPSARFDLKGGLDLFHRWLGAGFYYKTFMWPDWHLFEPMIRRMAGLGAVSDAVLEGYVADQLHDRCEVLVVGGGAAGLVAARSAAEAGQDVCLVEDHAECGGGVWQRAEIEGTAPADWVAAQVAAIVAAGGRVLTRATAFGVFDHRMVGIVENRAFGQAPRLRRMRAGRIVLASGALDRPVTFANNDRPGVMSVDGAGEMLARYGVLVGRRIAVVANNSAARAVLPALVQAGAEVVEVDPAAGPIRVLGAKRIRGLDQGGRRVEADTVLASGGLTPLVHLWRHAGGKLDWCDARQAFIPGRAPEGMVAVGAAAGAFDLESALEEARGVARGGAVEASVSHYHLTPLWPAPGAKGRQWIDFQHDVTLKDVELAARENYVSVEHLKRYTTLGMASDQGKTANMAGLAAMAAIQGRPIPEVGTTTFRPPFVPIPIETYHGAHRGQLWHPLKRLALEEAHRAAGAALGEYGGWLRPGWYGQGDVAQIIAEEVRMARGTAGIFDASPLGKIEVMGPDAEAFVDFVYYNTIRTLKPGHIRYGFLLSEGGAVMDDGVIARVDQDRFVISCSSSHVDGVRTHLEAWRQDGNDPDRIFIHDTTQHWATVTMTGPKAREIVGALGLEVDLSAEAFPHMRLREVVWQGGPLRIARVSFTGDVSFELSIRASRAEELWQALIAAGAPLGAGPLGLEALSIMRAEKGYLIIGKDTDGETMPHDLGFGIPRQKKTVAFIGDRSLHNAKANSTARKQLVGLRVAEGAVMLPTGAHVVEAGTQRSLGYVTSSYDSPTLDRPIALALIEDGVAQMGREVTIWHLGETRRATICGPCAFDPEGERLHA